jgi:L-amino acid N-acyltransferase YncA
MDTKPMADLLNSIIRRGGTTAMTKLVSGSDLKDWAAYYAGQNAWFVAEADDGELLGFQWVEPKPALPEDACDIATFTKVGRMRLGCGSALFQATRKAASNLGYKWINATIRSDNKGGLAYYQSRGFETYKTTGNVKLADGKIVTQISKRHDL